MKKSRKALMTSALCLLLCFTMLLGTTFAWFTDSVTSTNNIIKSGNLDVELEYWDGKDWKTVKGDSPLFEEDTLWEPGYTQTVYLRVANKGSLALKYQLGINIVNETTGTNVEEETFKLSDYIYMGVKEGVNGETGAYATREDAVDAVKDTSGIISTGYNKNGELAAGAKEQYLAVVVYMPTTVDNVANYKTGTNAPKITLGIKLLATQKDAELDSFGSDYDIDAEYPDIKFVGGNATAAVTATADNKVASDVTLQGTQISGTVPKDALLEEGATELTLSVSLLEETESGVTPAENESMVSVDVHVDGLAANNTEPVVVTMTGAVAKGLNKGNLNLYHVEKSGTNKMNQKDTVDAVKAHNDFFYDPATGDLTVAMATFSELAMTVDTEFKWEGGVDHTWYDVNAAELTIANADQLWSFSQIVGGMAEGIEQDSFSGKTVKLLCDINLADDEENNVEDKIFYPIGYWNDEGTYEKNQDKAISSGFYTFEGTFDGNGNTIANFYQNTWEMKGDHNWYDAADQHYRDGMGLFGKVYGGTVKNLTVENFKSDGEIATTGVIAAYADSKDGKPATFENISTTNCNPRVYNIGNGGIVGCAGWYSRNESLGNADYTNAVTFRNITVDQTNKISALWGSYDVSCGGILGQYYPDSGCGIKFENCHVAAIMDVNNDVCANYQYYWYRYSGMFIGTVRANTKDANGYTVADTTGIIAADCTYTLGDWNQYWYCELVANSKASYTHDHQFSRLTNISSVSEIQDESGNWNKAGNFVIPAADNSSATCYHIMKNSKGVLYRHVHDVADESNPDIYETFDLDGDGELNDLKEDRACYFMPFNQVMNGLGYGVKAHYEFAGITDKTDATDGVVKSEAKFNATENTEIPENGVVNIGDLFTASGNGSISSPTVQVYVSPVGYGSTVGATYSANVADWEKGTLTFSGTGSAKVVITDCFYCTKTVLNVTVGGVATAFEKFATKFDQDFLYRVGNASGSTVALGTMFKAVEGVTIDDSTVGVTFETIAGTADGEYTADTSTWTDGTVQFSGTGIVKVTISALGAEDFDLYLEVVDATNITSAVGTTAGGDFVLLCDINTTSYVNYWNCTLYGNGFTYSLNGAPTAYNSKQGHGVLITKNATLDNLVIVGDVYNSYGAYTTQGYYNAAVDVVGDTIIQNCYIANCAAPVKARADVTITNTTLYGGTVANLLIMSGTATLENVTTVNFDDGRDLVGMGIVIHGDATESAKLIINGTLTQYNFVSEEKVPTDTYAKNLHTAMFGDSCSQYHFGTSPNRYVNTGIISLTTLFGKDNITDNAKTGYVGNTVSVNNVNGYVYTQPNTSGSVNNEYNKDTDSHIATTQGAVAPTYNFDYTTKNYAAKADGSNDYCYEENGTVYISMDAGDTFNWDTSILTATKVGETLDYTVAMNGTDYTGKSITFNTAGEYTVAYTYTDNNNYGLDEGGNITTYSETYIKTVHITVSVVKAAWKNAEIAVTNTAMSGIYVMSGDYDYSYKMKFLDCVTITDYDEAGNASTVTLSESIASTSFVDANGNNPGKFDTNSGTITVTYSSGKVLTVSIGAWSGSGPSTKTCSVKTDDGVYLITDGASNAANTGVTWKVVGYTYTGNNGAIVSDDTIITFTWDTNSEGYNSKDSGSCVTPDTLVTLADGTQKRIDTLTGDEMLLVWNHTTGAFDVAPVAYIVDHEGCIGEEIITHLYFDNGYEIKMIGEHVFFDNTLNKYAALTTTDAEAYIGHSFAVKSGDALATAKLVKVDQYVEKTAVYEVVSYEHIACFTNNILSASAYLDQLLNIFDINPEAMAYTAEDVLNDIETYGLYTYADFEGLIEEEAFELYNAKYLKIAVGKGYITWDDILALIDIYFGVNVEPIQ